MTLFQRLGILTVIALLMTASFSTDVIAAEEPEAEVLAEGFDQTRALNWTLFVAVVLTLTHFNGPRFRPLIEARKTQVSSFGGGMAVAYVFLHLLVELEEGKEVMGRWINIFVLIGFGVYYGLEHFIRLRHPTSQEREVSKLACGTEIAFGWVYTWLILYSLPESVQHNGFNLIPIFPAIVFHLFYSDFHLGSEYPTHFSRWGRHVLATAPLVGWLGDLFFFEDNPFVSDPMRAVLAGALIFKVFRYELPDERHSRFVWFLIGMLVFLTLDVLSGK